MLVELYSINNAIFLIMKLHSLLLIIPFVLLSCGSTRTITDRADIVALSTKRVLKNHAKNNFDRNTLTADLKVSLKKSSRSQSMSVKMRIAKDSMIWLSGTVFGFPVAKAIITPERVSYYIKINKTYFDGDYSQINKLLGAELDFTMLQNLLLGDAIFKMNAKNYDSEIDQQAHLLTSKQENAITEILLWFHPINFKIEKQEIRTSEKNRFLSVEYKGYNKIDNTSIPGKISILVKDTKNNASIDLDYKSVRLDEKLSFPYKIPSGYKRILK